METKVIVLSREREEREKREEKREEGYNTTVIPMPLPKLNARERCKRDLNNLTLTQLNTARDIAKRHRDFEMIGRIEIAIEERCNNIQKNIAKAREATAIVYKNILNNKN